MSVENVEKAICPTETVEVDFHDSSTTSIEII